MPPAPPRDLTLPLSGSTTTRDWLSWAVRDALSATLRLLARSPGWFARDALPALREDPGLLSAAMLAPSRLTLARCLALHPSEPPAVRARWLLELTASLALDAAEAGKLPREIPLPPGLPPIVSERSGRRLVVPSGAQVLLSSSGLVVRTSAGEARVGFDAPDDALARVGASWSAARAPLFARAELVLQDTNPLAHIEAHPDKAGNAVDLGGLPPGEWAAPLGRAFAMLEAHLPEIAAEMRLMLRQVVPVGFDAERHLSASYLEATGVVYLSLHPSEITLAEALVHEFQHNKLNLVLGAGRALENEDAPLYASPVRPDPRPLRGVLLAVHAFQPVVRLHERLLAAGAGPPGLVARRLVEVARTCREGAEVLLTHGRPTPLGAPLLDEIRALDAAFAVHLPAGG